MHTPTQARKDEQQHLFEQTAQFKSASQFSLFHVDSPPQIATKDSKDVSNTHCLLDGLSGGILFNHTMRINMAPHKIYLLKHFHSGKGYDPFAREHSL